MKCYMNNSHFTDSINLYESVNDVNNIHDDVSHILYLKSCANIGQYEKGKKMIKVVG